MEEREDIILKLIEHNTKSIMLLKQLEEEERYVWALSFIGNILHDIPEDVRKEFFKNYEELRDGVNKMMVS